MFSQTFQVRLVFYSFSWNSGAVYGLQEGAVNDLGPLSVHVLVLCGQLVSSGNVLHIGFIVDEPLIQTSPKL